MLDGVATVWKQPRLQGPCMEGNSSEELSSHLRLVSIAEIWS